ncbi:MAG: hypothetical protein JSR46_09145, partial [Verrucomicrobia bacterium]|nr:hypothetical protein [Verrucomicrobiota bacterium]
FMANVMLKQFPATTNRLALVEADVEISRQFISKYFTLNPELTTHCLDWGEARSLLEAVFPALKGSFHPNEQSDPGVVISQDNKTQIAFSSGELVSTDPTLFKAYKNTLDRDMQELFVTEGLYTKEEIGKQLRSYQDGSIRYIRDAKNNRDFAVKQGKIFAKMTIEGREVWAEHIPNKKKVDAGIELAKYHQRHIGQTVYLCDSKTLEPVYKVSESDRKVYEIASGLHIVKGPSQTSLFSRFESEPSIIFLAEKNEQIKKVHFPRHNLHFSLQVQGGKEQWVCEEQKGWSLAKEQFAPHLGPETGFLVLERTLPSGKYEQKVLIPVWDPQAVKDRALNFPYSFDFKEENTRTGHFVECTLEANRLVPSSLEARFHVGRIYLEKGFQKDAEDILFDSRAELTNKSMTHKERQALERIVHASFSGNMSGRALSTRLHALYLLER